MGGHAVDDQKQMANYYHCTRLAPLVLVYIFSLIAVGKTKIKHGFV